MSSMSSCRVSDCAMRHLHLFDLVMRDCSQELRQVGQIGFCNAQGEAPVGDDILVELEHMVLHDDGDAAVGDHLRMQQL